MVYKVYKVILLTNTSFAASLRPLAILGVCREPKFQVSWLNPGALFALGMQQLMYHISMVTKFSKQQAEIV
jgi:hypothetical protein